MRYLLIVPVSEVTSGRLAARPVGRRTSVASQWSRRRDARVRVALRERQPHARRSDVCRIPIGHCVSSVTSHLPPSFLFIALLTCCLTCRSLFARFAHFAVGRSSISFGFTMTSIHKSTHRYLHAAPESSGCSFEWGCTSVKLPYATIFEYMHLVSSWESSALSLLCVHRVFSIHHSSGITSELRIRGDTRTTDLP